MAPSSLRSVENSGEPVPAQTTSTGSGAKYVEAQVAAKGWPRPQYMGGKSMKKSASKRNLRKRSASRSRGRGRAASRSKGRGRAASRSRGRGRAASRSRGRAARKSRSAGKR
jgi:hypothetical protein